MKHRIKPMRFGWLLALVTMLAGCDEIDCTLYNTVYLRGGFYSDGSQVALADTLSITSGLQGPTLLNRETGASACTLAMSYWQETDTLVLTVWSDEYLLRDTIWIDKTNRPHFESPDCPTNMFHELTAISCTHTFLDSVRIVQPHVNYTQDENIQIFIHPAP